MAYVTFTVAGNSSPPPFATNYGATEIIIQPGLNEISDEAAAYLEALTPQEWAPRQNLTFSESPPIVEPPPTIDPPSPPPPTTSATAADLGEIPDIENMNADEAIAAIQKVADHEVLEMLLEAEQAGKKRKTVVKELQDLLS